jgi:hypothetical protein
MAWDALEASGDSVAAIVASAAQAVSHLREASHALAVLEEVRAAQQACMAPPHHQQQQQQQQQDDQLQHRSQGESAGSSDSAGAAYASERVHEALLGLLRSQRQGPREQRRAYDHLRMVLETYVSRPGACSVVWSCTGGVPHGPFFRPVVGAGMAIGARVGASPPTHTLNPVALAPLPSQTDVVRYPRPRRPDAAVIVAAESDAYVSTESVRALHAHWPGSELRLVSGGHGECCFLSGGGGL